MAIIRLPALALAPSAQRRVNVRISVEAAAAAIAPTLTASHQITKGLLKFTTHSYRVQKIAAQLGWLPGARYTNLRDVRKFDRLGFLDIDWKNYDFKAHIKAARSTQPLITIARDIEQIKALPEILDQASELRRYANIVVVVPKARRLGPILEDVIPPQFILGFSVPTRYGGTKIPLKYFQRPVHLLGGRPDVQRKLGNQLTVHSLDCNRFTLDAAFGDYFDGETFRPHPKGGYERCIRESLRNINRLWGLDG